jgi:hypothetical protein
MVYFASHKNVFLYVYMKILNLGAVLLSISPHTNLRLIWALTVKTQTQTAFPAMTVSLSQATTMSRPQSNQVAKTSPSQARVVRR